MKGHESRIFVLWNRLSFLRVYRPLRYALVVTFFGGLIACSEVPSESTVASFDDHTIAKLKSPDDYFRFAAQGIGRRVVKYVITKFDTPAVHRISFLNGQFYSLHDEWYWFRLLNGRAIAGIEVKPVSERRFSSIEAIYQWAKNQSELPLDLNWTDDGRLYSNRFYQYALSRPQKLGLGGLMHILARDGEQERWLFELEYSDKITHERLVWHFEILESNLSKDIAAKIKWVVRSPQQETIAQEMEAKQLAFYDRILRYSDLAVPGEVEVYSEGLTAGRIRVIRTGEVGLELTHENDVLILEEVPDWLPPASAVITSVPQTPLAHINVLARNRGIPNLYKGGVLDDPALDQLQRVRAPVIVRGVAPDQVDLVSMTEDEYAQWSSAKVLQPLSLPPVDVSKLPLTMTLENLDIDEMAQLRLSVGGKAAGFLGLMSSTLVDYPDDPLAITIKSYVEHLAPLRSLIHSALEQEAFLGSRRTRYLVLEGPVRFSRHFMSPQDLQYLDSFSEYHPAGNALGDLVRLGGLVNAIRNQAVDPMTLARIEDRIRTHFDEFHVEQGLRFRSSSTVEDIEGFNGAGLYDSNTGFLVPMVQVDEADRERTIERALRRTWSSYWHSEAFEERHREAIDHLSGNMAVLVHARFDDSLELANGVFTFTLHPPESALVASMEMNVQKGELSVSNPDLSAGILPQIDRVLRYREQSGPLIFRLRSSSLVEPGETLLSNGQLIGIFDAAQEVSTVWLSTENASVSPAQQQRTLTLDFELRHMAAGWPKRMTVSSTASRLIIKQARSLEPGLRAFGEGIRALPLPKDILSRTQRLIRWHCNFEAFEAQVLEAFTNPLLSPDLGYSERPFVGSIELFIHEDVSELSLVAGSTLTTTHVDFLNLDRTEDAEHWRTRVELDASRFGLSSIELTQDGRFQILTPTKAHGGSNGLCGFSLLFSNSEEMLLELLKHHHAQGS